MATGYVGANSGDGGSSSALTATCTVPGTAVAGDILVAFASAERGLIPTITGHTGSPNSVFWNVADGTQMSVYAYWKTVVAGDIGATLTATVSSGRRLAVGCLVISGGDPANVDIVQNSTTTSGTLGSGINDLALPDITPDAADCMLVGIVLSCKQSTPWTIDSSAITGSFTERVDDTSTSASSADAGVHAWTKQLSGQNGVLQTGPTATFNTNIRYFSAMMAIAPMTTITVTLTDTIGVADTGSTFVSQFAGEDSVGLTDNITVITPVQVDVDGSPFSIIGTAVGTPLNSSYVAIVDAIAALFKVGAQVQLYQPGGTLREATVFRVTAVSAPAFGFRNVTVTPNFASIVAANDTLRQTGWAFTADTQAALTKFADSALALTFGTVGTMARIQDIAGANLGLTLTQSGSVSVDRPLVGTMAVTWSGSAAALLTSVGTSTLPLTYGTSASATSTLALSSTLALTNTLAATATRDRPIAGSLTMTAGFTAVADVVKGGNSTLPLTSTLTAAASRDRSVAGALATTYATTATATRDRPVSAALNATVGFTASMTVNRDVAATLAMTYTTGATALRTAIVSGTLALTDALNADTQGNPSLQASLSLTESFTAFISGLRFTDSSLATTAALAATAATSAQAQSGMSLNFNMGATATVSKFVNANQLDLGINFTASTEAQSDVDSTRPIAFTASGSMLADHVATSNLASTLPLTASLVRQRNTTAVDLNATATLAATAVISGGVAQAAGLALGASFEALATVTHSLTSALSLTLPLTGLINSSQRVMGNIALAFGLTAVADQAPTFIGDEQGPDYLNVQRRLTRAYIQENPAVITLTPHFKTRTESAGYTQVVGADRPAQVMRFIETGMIGGTRNPGRTETGFIRVTEFQLMAEHDATIQPNDTFSFDGRYWRVQSIMPHNGYEVRAVVERYGE